MFNNMFFRTIFIYIAYIVIFNNIAQAAGDNIFYCPDRIMCGKNNDAGSCQVISDTNNKGFWQNFRTNDRIKNGEYYFDGASVSKRQVIIDATCSYRYFDINLGRYYYIAIGGYVDHFDAKYFDEEIERNSSWYEHNLTAYSCRQPENHDVSACLFMREPALFVNSVHEIRADANGVPLVMSSSKLKISKSHIAKGCPDLTICNINLFVRQQSPDHSNYYINIPIGSVTVDVQKDMTILDIGNIESSGYKIGKNDDTNSVYIEPH